MSGCGTFITSAGITDQNTVTAGDFYSYEATARDSGNRLVVDGGGVDRTIETTRAKFFN